MNILDNPQNTNRPLRTWLGYGAEFITILFALLVLSGRVYAQSYWNVFGLSPELVGSNFLNYAIVSPNVALASILMAAGTISFVAIYFRRNTIDIVGNSNLRITFIVGWVVFLLGVYGTVVLRINSSSWTAGVAGIVFGMAYLFSIGGLMTWLQAMLKLENKEPSKLERSLLGWTKKVPFIIIQIFFIVGILTVSLWGILDTSQKFGANEAKFALVTKPEVILTLDSTKGFEDITTISKTGNVNITNASIVLQTQGFTYFCYGFTKDPLQLLVRA